MRALVRAAAVAAALALAARPAAAQGGLTARARYLGGYTHESPATLGSPHDLWTGVVPELSYLHVDLRWVLRSTYAFTAALHTRNATEVANRITLLSSFEATRRLSLLFLADANQTSLSNYLITRPLFETSVVAVPTSNSRLLTSTASQGLRWEATPRVFLGQSLDATYVMSLDPEIAIENVFANAGLTLDRAWKRDAIGGELRVGYASVDTPPAPAQNAVTITATPRWRRDLTASLSTSIAAGASVAFSPEGDPQPVLLPFGRAALLYTSETTTAELGYVGGVQPTTLTGQILRSHLVSMRAITPLSERHHVMLGGSIGYLRGSAIDLRGDSAPPPNLDALLADADVSWLVNDWLSLFARGLFLAQDTGAAAPRYHREALIVGFQLSTRAPDGVAIPLRFPQRIDQADATRQR
jgi:hypothetical protein